VIVVLAVAAVVAVLAGMGLRACPTKPPGDVTACEKFVRTPQFLVWLMLLCAEGAFWLLAFFPVVAALRDRGKELREARQLSRRAYLALAVPGLGVAAILAASAYFFRHPLPGFSVFKVHEGYPSHWPLQDHSLRVGILSAVALSVGLLAMVVVWFAGLLLQQMASDVTKPDKATIDRFLGLQDDLNTMLAIAGGIIGLATLATGALRNAARAVDLPFNPQYILLYGLFFTGVLAIAYAPSYFAMRAAGTRMRDRTYPLPNPDDSTFFDVIDKRKKFDEFMQLNLSASSTFKAGVAILTPLLSGLIALLIPKFT
jgi:hypothetical protein